MYLFFFGMVMEIFSIALNPFIYRELVLSPFTFLHSPLPPFLRHISLHWYSSSVAFSYKYPHFCFMQSPLWEHFFLHLHSWNKLLWVCSPKCCMIPPLQSTLRCSVPKVHWLQNPTQLVFSWQHETLCLRQQFTQKGLDNFKHKHYCHNKCLKKPLGSLTYSTAQVLVMKKWWWVKVIVTRKASWWLPRTLSG